MQVSARFKSIGSICASRPHVWLVPLALMGLMMGFGIWAVSLGASSSADAARQKAQSHVESAASAMQLTIQDSIMPAVQLADWIKHTLNVSTLVNNWSDRVPDWWARAPASAMLLAMGPSGVIAAQWPNGSGPSLVGADLLQHPVIRYMMFETIQHGDITVAEPSDIGGTYIMTFQIPIFIYNVSKSDMYGIPEPYDCDLCYNATTRTRWWGNAALTVMCTAFTDDNGPLAALLLAGYRRQIWRTPQARINETDWQVVNSNGTVAQPADAVFADLPVGNTKWRVYVWQDSWEPNWKRPLIAVVVVLSIVCGLLTFAVLISWEEHRLLLLSILPKDTIDRMRLHMDWQRAAKNKHDLDVIAIETPAQHMLTILKAFLAGDTPAMPLVVAVKQALERSADVYRPASQELQTRIAGAANMDAEVQRALVQQLAGSLQSSGDLNAGRPQDMSADMREVIVVHNGDNDPPHARSTPKALVKTRSSAHSGELSHKQHSGIRDSNPAAGDSMALFSFIKTSDNTPDMATLLAALNGKPSLDPLISTTDVDPAEVVALQQIAASPEKPMLSHLERVLETANTWTFDAYALEEASQGHPLSVMGFWLMHKYGCVELAGVDPQVLARFLRKVEGGYKKNAYHNARHAADVLQTLHMILHQGGLTPGYCDPLTMLACYLAAVVHDYEHLGRSNDFLINTADTLAVRYNDKSPMENHHLAAAWELLHDPRYNFLSGLSKSNWDKVRKLVIDLVLATDMRQHFAIMGQFSTLHSTQQASVQQVSESVAGSVSSIGKPEDAAPVPGNESDRLLGLQVALKCADLGHLAAPLPVHLKWVSGLEEELFLQGDAERARGLPISPLCDRNGAGVTKSQVGFFEVVVLPLYSTFAQRFTASKPLLKAVVANYQYWKGKASNK